MRLSAIGLRNFKAFGPALQTIPIKPITLVFGKNSAGKSSLLHSLLWLNHATTRGETDIHEPVAAAGTVNLGGFDACINQGSRREEKDWLHINIHVANPLLRTESAKWLGNVSEFVVRMAVKRGNSISEPSLSNFKIDVDGQTLFYGSPYHSGRSASALVNWDHPVIPLKEKLPRHSSPNLNRYSFPQIAFHLSILTSIRFIRTKKIRPDGARPLKNSRIYLFKRND